MTCGSGESTAWLKRDCLGVCGPFLCDLEALVWGYAASPQVPWLFLPAQQEQHLLQKAQADMFEEARCTLRVFDLFHTFLSANAKS